MSGQWQLVPKEPNFAMLDELSLVDGFTYTALTARYKAMLAAAPQPDVSEMIRLAAQGVVDLYPVEIPATKYQVQVGGENESKWVLVSFEESEGGMKLHNVLLDARVSCGDMWFRPVGWNHGIAFVVRDDIVYQVPSGRGGVVGITPFASILSGDWEIVSSDDVLGVAE